MSSNVPLKDNLPIKEPLPELLLAIEAATKAGKIIMDAREPWFKKTKD